MPPPRHPALRRRPRCRIRPSSAGKSACSAARRAAACALALAALATPAPTLAAQARDRESAPGAEVAADRIWGRVHTRDGGEYEGFIVWRGRGVGDGAWTDVLEGFREVPGGFHEAWLSATERTRPVRTIELKGYRISWDEEDPEFPSSAAAGVRFGHVAEVEVDGDRFLARLRPADGESEAPSVRFGVPSRRRAALQVFDRHAGEREVPWRDLRRAEFFAPPAGVVAPSRRLHGAVEDRSGRTFTGYVAWDSDEILDSEALDGWDEDGDDREIPFKDVLSIERDLGTTRVALASGGELALSGTNDVGRGNRGARVFDPALGMVHVEWDELASLRLEAPSGATAAYEDFAGSWRLEGRVVTEQGDTLSGLLRWNAEHEWSWELLRGTSRGVGLAIEFGAVARIERKAAGAAVTLADGRVFDLEAPADLDWESRGIFVRVKSEPGAAQRKGRAESTAARAESDPVADGADWLYVPWNEFREAQFVAPAPGGDES